VIALERNLKNKLR